jgi:hypothetical protein
MEAVCSSKSFVDFYYTTMYYILEDGTLQENIVQKQDNVMKQET